MPKVSKGSTNALVIASGFITIHLLPMLIEKDLLSVEEGATVLKQARNDMARAAEKDLDLTLMDAEDIVAGLYARLPNHERPRGETAAHASA